MCINKLTIIAAVSALAVSCIGCFMYSRTPLQLADPIKTLETFQRALSRRQWKIASMCLSDEIRASNSKFIEDPVLYSTFYWQSSRGLEMLLTDTSPLLEQEVLFEMKEQMGETAVVSVKYLKNREKTVRLREVSLQKDLHGNWKISKIFGTTTGRPPKSTSDN